MAWVDAAHQRVDRHGCVCREVTEDAPCAYTHCNRGSPPQPKQWHSMVRTVKKLGNVIGIHMRIDLYAGETGAPVLGEFTPWHANGKMHCHMRRLTANQVNATQSHFIFRRDGLTNEMHRVDPCQLGRQWREYGPAEGGSFDPRPPHSLRGWGALMFNEEAKCAAAIKLLRPTRMDRASLPPALGPVAGSLRRFRLL